MPNGSRVPCTTSIGTVTASSSGSRLCAGVEPDLRGGCRGNARQRTPTAPVASAVRQATRAPEDRPPTTSARPPQLACDQVVDHRRPRRIELMRRSGRTPTRDPVGLLDERDAQSHRVCNARHRDKILRLHPATSAVTEDERGPRVVCATQMRVRRSERRVDLERLHRGDAATPTQSGRSGTVNPCSRPSRTARVTAVDPNRRRTSSSATSRAVPLKRSSGSTS